MTDTAKYLFTRLGEGYFSDPLPEDPNWSVHDIEDRRRAWARWELSHRERPLDSDGLYEGLERGAFFMHDDLRDDPLWNESDLADRQAAYQVWTDPSLAQCLDESSSTASSMPVGGIIQPCTKAEPEPFYVTKVEGAFLGEDEFEYDKVRHGVMYRYTVVSYSRPVTQAEALSVKWAYQVEGKDVQFFEHSGYIDEQGNLSKRISFVEGTVDKTVHVMPYAVNPTKNVSVEVEVIADQVVYLTFDDGIQPGTAEVLALLEVTKVPGTFFVTGINTEYYEKYYSGAEALLNVIKDKHQIANHSYSHANDFYGNYYRDGLKIGTEDDGDFIFRSVVDDFEKNEAILGGFVAAARFPGRNTWRLPGITITDSDNSDDTKDEADELARKGYAVYGWDKEWEMSFEGKEYTETLVNQLASAGVIEWDNLEHTRPFIDFNSSEFSTFDRVTDSPSDVLSKIEDTFYHTFVEGDNSQKENKAILLMHDRAFRGQEAAAKLAELIILLKRKGYGFGKLKTY